METVRTGLTPEMRDKCLLYRAAITLTRVDASRAGPSSAAGSSSQAGPSAAGLSSAAAGPSTAAAGSSMQARQSAAAEGSSRQARQLAAEAGPSATARSPFERPSQAAGTTSAAISRASGPPVRALFQGSTPRTPIRIPSPPGSQSAELSASEVGSALRVFAAREEMSPSKRQRGGQRTGPTRPSQASGSQRAARTPSATAQTRPSPAAQSQRAAQTPATTAPSASARASRASPPSNATTTTRAARPQMLVPSVVGKLLCNSNKV